MSTGVVLKIVALLLGVLEAVFLIGLGASIPADDWFWGDLGQWLVCAGIVLGSLLVIAWLFPRFGGTVLVIVGGLAAISGLTLTIQAGLVFGAAPLVSGLLFVRAGSRSAVSDDRVRGARGTSATPRADRPY
jgi:hypothetical protein